MGFKEAIEIIEGKIASLLEERPAVTVAIDGGSATGKSTLAEALAKKLGANLFHIDDFFLRPEQRSESRLKEIGGNMDRERFFSEVICGIKSKMPFDYRAYSCKSGTLCKPIFVTPKRVSIIEGVYSLHPDLRDNYDLKIFLKVPYEVRRERIIKRSPDKAESFFSVWIPMENSYFEAFDCESESDIIIEL